MERRYDDVCQGRESLPLWRVLRWLHVVILIVPHVTRIPERVQEQVAGPSLRLFRDPVPAGADGSPGQ